MPPWWLTFILLLLVAWKAWPLVQAALSRRERARVHESLIRRILGCRLCHTRFWADQPYMTCGVRADWNVCVPCYNAQMARLEGEAPRGFFHEVLEAEVLTSSVEAAPSTAEAIDRALVTFAPRRCLGHLPQGSTEYRWLTYGETRLQAHAVGEGLLRCRAGLVPGRSVVGLLARVSVDWMLADYACLLKGLVSVPLPKSLSVAALAHVIRLSCMSGLVASEHLRPLVRAALAKVRATDPAATLPSVVVWLKDGPEAYAGSSVAVESEGGANAAGAWPAGVGEMPWAELVSLGQFAEASDKLTVHSPKDPSAIVKLIPTSGSSTGLPKLTVMTEHMLRPAATQGRKKSGGDMIVFAYELLKQSHDVISAGGSIGVYSGSVAGVFKDCQALRPTVLGAPPTLWHSLFLEFQGDVNRACSAGCNDDAKAFAEQRVLERWKNKCMLGNRLKSLVCSGAVLRKDIKSWAFKVFGAALEDGYGTTETGGLASNGRVKRNAGIQLADCPELGYLTCDVPWPRGEVLASTDRLTPGYFDGSTALNRIDKTGELRAVVTEGGAFALHTKDISTGVDTPAAAGGVAADDSFVTIGGKRYFRTGDIAELRRGGELRIIDRRKAFFKLSQGLFVAPAPLEAVFGKATGVHQICVLSTPRASTVTAVVVPSASLCRAALDLAQGATGANEDGVVGSDAHLRRQLVANDKAREGARRQLSASFAKLSKEHNTKPWEVPRVILFESEPFTEWNGLISRMGKLCRPALSQKYRERAAKESAEQQHLPLPDERKVAVDDKSGGGAAARVGDFDDEDEEEEEEKEEKGKEKAANAAAQDTICRGLLSLLSEAGVMGRLSPDQRLDELGLDSMGMARLSARFSERFGVSLPVKLLLSAQPSLRALQRAMFEGPEAIVASAAPPVDWSAEAGAALQLSERAFKQWSAAGRGRVTAIRGRAPAGVPENVPVLLVTGATGFLGAFVLDELAKAVQRRTLSSRDAGTGVIRIVCVVRARTDRKAWDRLARTMAHYVLWPKEPEEGDEPGKGPYGLLGKEQYGPGVQVTAVAGDVSLPMLGLSVPRFKSLCTSTAAVYHCAAHVNSSQGYTAHKPCNVTGMAHMLAFAGCCAVEARRQHETSGWMHADSPRVLQFNYVSTQGLLCGRKAEKLDLPLPKVAEKVLRAAGGYAQSKHVAEQLLLRVAPMQGVSMRVFRPGVIGPHTRLGSANCKDFVNLLVCGLATLGVVCERRGAVALPARFNLSPVDYVAQSIVRIAPLPAGSGAVTFLPIAPARTPSPFAAGGPPPARTPSPFSPSPSPSPGPAPPSVPHTPSDGKTSRMCATPSPAASAAPSPAPAGPSPMMPKKARRSRKKLRVTVAKGRGFSKDVSGTLFAEVQLGRAMVKTDAVARSEVEREGEEEGEDSVYEWRKSIKYDITRMKVDAPFTLRVFEEGFFEDVLVGEAVVPLSDLDAALLGLGMASRAAEVWLEVRHIHTRKLVGEVLLLTRREDSASVSQSSGPTSRTCSPMPGGSPSSSRGCFGGNSSSISNSGETAPSTKPERRSSSTSRRGSLAPREEALGPDDVHGPLDESRNSALAQLEKQADKQALPAHNGAPPVYHLHSPVNVELPMLCAWVRAAGYPLRNVPADEFKRAVAAAQPVNPLYVFKSQLVADVPPEVAARAERSPDSREPAGPDADNTRAALAQATRAELALRINSMTAEAPGDASAPAAVKPSQESFRRALAFLALKGLLPMPSRH